MLERWRVANYYMHQHGLDECIALSDTQKQTAIRLAHLLSRRRHQKQDEASSNRKHKRSIVLALKAPAMRGKVLQVLPL